NLAGDAAAAYYADLCFLKPASARALLGLEGDVRYTALYESVTAPYRRCPSTDPVQRAEYADLKVYLPNDVLVKVDRMTMQHGLGAGSAVGGLMDVGAVRRLFDEHKAGARKHSYALWAIWMLERWHKLQSQPHPAAPAPILLHA